MDTDKITVDLEGGGGRHELTHHGELRLSHSEISEKVTVDISGGDFLGGISALILGAAIVVAAVILRAP